MRPELDLVIRDDKRRHNYSVIIAVYKKTIQYVLKFVETQCLLIRSLCMENLLQNFVCNPLGNFTLFCWHHCCSIDCCVIIFIVVRCVICLFPFLVVCCDVKNYKVLFNVAFNFIFISCFYIKLDLQNRLRHTIFRYLLGVLTLL